MKSSEQMLWNWSIIAGVIMLPVEASASHAVGVSTIATIIAFYTGIVWGLVCPFVQLWKAKRRLMFYCVSAIYGAGTVWIVGSISSTVVAQLFGIPYYVVDIPQKMLMIICMVMPVIVAGFSTIGLSRIRRFIDE